MLLRVRGINRVRAKGRVYYYHRRTGTRIKAAPGTAEFVAEVNRLDGISSATTAEKTLGKLIDAYRAAIEFTDLAEATRDDYQRIFDRLHPLAGMPLEEIDAPFLVRLRDTTKGGRRAKNYIVQVASSVFGWGALRGWLTANPAKGIPMLKPPKGAPVRVRPWEARELRAIMDAATPGVRLAVALGYYAGIRQGDVLRLPWSAYDGEWLTLRQRKTGREIRVPVHRELKRVLDASAKTKSGPVIVTGEQGRPYTGEGFRAMFGKLKRGLQREGLVGSALTFHGLRHTLATAIIEAGHSSRAVAAVLGQETEAMGAHYSKRAERTALASAAITSLERKRKRTAKPAAKPRQGA